jgi:hypothetical protein
MLGWAGYRQAASLSGGIGQMAEEKTASEKLVNNVILTLVARGAIIVATGLILPAASLLGAGT